MSISSRVRLIEEGVPYNCQTDGLDAVLPEGWIVPREMHVAFASAFAARDDAQALDLYQRLLKSVWGEEYDFENNVGQYKIENRDQLQLLLKQASRENRPITFFVDGGCGVHAVSACVCRDYQVDGEDQWTISSLKIEESQNETIAAVDQEMLLGLVMQCLLITLDPNALLWPAVYDRISE